MAKITIQAVVENYPIAVDGETPNIVPMLILTKDNKLLSAQLDLQIITKHSEGQLLLTGCRPLEDTFGIEPIREVIEAIRTDCNQRLQKVYTSPMHMGSIPFAKLLEAYQALQQTGRTQLL